MSDKQPKIDKQALSTRYPDLLDTQVDADLLQVIDDLDTLYTSAALPEQLISGRAQDIWGRARELEEPGRPQGSPVQYITRGRFDDLSKRRGAITFSSSRNRPVVALRRKRWLNRLNAFAAVLIAALLVGSLLVVTRLAQRSQQGNTGGHTNSTAPQCIISQAHNSNAWLSSLHMIDAMTGWALGVDHITGLHRILRTTNGGTSWQDVTPSQPGSTPTSVLQKIAFAGEPYFLNACAAWVALVQTGNAPALLFRTGDGGKTWQQSTLPGSEIRGIDFIDAHMGWLTVDVLKNGKFAEEDFYHSVDGGQSWTKIAISRPATNNQPGALPFANADNNPIFINATTGWITGALSVSNNPRLYITHDGGRTWHQQLLPPPSNSDSRIFKSGTVVWQPQFFSAREGILPVSFWSTNSLDIYVTHDGGNSWQDTSLLRFPATPNLDVYAPTPDPIFVDSNHGWAGAWQKASILYATSDGGKHWRKIVPGPNLQYTALIDYDFVTGKTGWAIGAFTGKSPVPVPPMLFKTEDGGETWRYIKRG